MGAKKRTIPQSTINRVWFKYAGLFMFKLLWENQKSDIKKTKRSMCIYMAQKNRSFIAMWLKAHPKKKYPKHQQHRKAIGLKFYHNIVADSRRYKDLNYISNLLKKGDRKSFYYLMNKGKLLKKKI